MNLHDYMLYAWLTVHCNTACWPFDKMSKREISNTFGGERSKETKEDKYQYQLRKKATIARQNLWKNTRG